ncbi:MAG: hypothetical protein WBM38_08050 [Arenicellales bacterium]
MKNLSKDLKRMLSALAYQDADDYLSMHEKMAVLGYETNAGGKSLKQHLKVIKRPKAKRIALISDGRGFGAPLDYAIDACLRQDAHIDLLFHGAIDTNSIAELEKRVKQAGIDYQRVQLGVNVIDEIIDYIQHQRSLIFVVAMPDDAVAKTLIEEVIPKSGGRIPVPLVLIEEKAVILKQDHSDTHVLPSFGT